MAGFATTVYRRPAWMAMARFVRFTSSDWFPRTAICLTGGETLVGQSQLVDKLRELARNLWWVWQPNVIALFRELDPALWRKLDHNPVEFLKLLPTEQLERRAAEMALDSRIDYAFRRLSEYLKDTDSWGAVHASILRSRPVAYLSAEFGLHESLPIYSGGLGVLAGDHLKSASDLGIPLIGIGLLYAQGYFRQSLDAEGWQQESYLNTDLDLLPIEGVIGSDGQPLKIAIETATGMLKARIWRVEVGRTTLLLLDANLPENSESDRALTARLYGGDARVRIRQELLLGVGGLRALRALEITPSVLHLNEGHSAFATLEMIRAVMESTGLPFGEVMRDVAGMTVFTTHTPVAAGHDRFPAGLVEEHLGKIREGLHLSYEDFMGLGRVNPGDYNEPFCMTVLALKLSRYANGVSALHGVVSRRMWRPLFPSLTEESVPIGHITNGVHVQTWVAPQMSQLFDRHLGVDWPRDQRLPETWEGIETVDDAELWETKQVLKARLINFVRRRLRATGPPPRRARRGRPENDRSARLERPDDRVCQAVCHLQARRPDPARCRSAHRSGQVDGPSRADHLRRQGSPRGPVRQGADPGHRADDAAGAVLQSHRIRGRLRYERRSFAGPGSGRLAEQPTPSPGGQRHLGREGDPQRHPQLLGPRRLVG